MLLRPNLGASADPDAHSHTSILPRNATISPSPRSMLFGGRRLLQRFSGRDSDWLDLRIYLLDRHQIHQSRASGGTSHDVHLRLFGLSSCRYKFCLKIDLDNGCRIKTLLLTSWLNFMEEKGQQFFWATFTSSLVRLSIIILVFKKFLAKWRTDEILPLNII